MLGKDINTVYNDKHFSVLNKQSFIENRKQIWHKETHSLWTPFKTTEKQTWICLCPSNKHWRRSPSDMKCHMNTNETAYCLIAPIPTSNLQLTTRWLYSHKARSYNSSYITAVWCLRHYIKSVKLCCENRFCIRYLYTLYN